MITEIKFYFNAEIVHEKEGILPVECSKCYMNCNLIVLNLIVFGFQSNAHMKCSFGKCIVCVLSKLAICAIVISL